MNNFEECRRRRRANGEPFDSLQSFRTHYDTGQGRSQADRHTAYLLAEYQLVVKEEEDSLLAASVRLIYPRQLPSVDQF